MKTHNRQTLFIGRRTLSLTLLALLAAGRVAVARQDAPRLDWREFTSEAGGFSIKFPGEPRISRPRLTMGPLTFSLNVHQVSVGDYSFEMNYLELPEGGNPEYGNEGSMRGLINRTLAEGGRVLSDGKVTRGACEGREVSVSLPARPGTSRFKQLRGFSSGRYYYHLLFTAGKDSPEAREAGRLYMDSFVIKDGCAAKYPAASPDEIVRSAVEGRHDAATGWRSIESTEHGFSVLMPGAARRTSIRRHIQSLSIFFHDYVHETEDAVYMAKMQGDFPKDFFVSGTQLVNQLDMSIYILKNNLEPRGFSFGEMREFKVGALPVREYVLTNESAGMRGRARLYATSRRAYIFVAFSRGARPAADADLERFFSSIKVSPK